MPCTTQTASLNAVSRLHLTAKKLGTGTMHPAKNRKDTQNLPQLKHLKLPSLSRGIGSSLYFHHFQNHQA
jgi:hypothetical protein